MGKASSAKKVARLAERGKGKKVRFQNGTVFPMIIAVVVVLGLVLVGYARNSSKVDAAGPKVQDHWHIAYGIKICDEWLDPFQANKEDTTEYQRVQIHSHGDGVMHWHPGQGAINVSTGRKAQFHVFLDLYNVDLSDSKLTIAGSELTPPGADIVKEEGKDTCPVNGKEEKASLRVVVWDRYDDPNGKTVRTSSLGDERILKDQQVFAVFFVADSVDNNSLELPPWAADLPELGAADLPGATTAVPTTAPVPTDASGSTVATTVAPSTSAAAAPETSTATTAPATTSAPTTSG